MPEQVKPERKKLTIIEVKPIQDGTRSDGGKWQNLSFKARDGESELWYGCYKTDLFPLLAPGAVLDADVTTKSTERGTFQNVTMLYQDGQPVARKPGFSRGKSPEEIASEETQTKAKIIAELWKAGKYMEIDPRITWLNKWLEDIPIKNHTQSQPGTPQPEAKKPEARPTGKQDHVAGFERMFLVESMRALKWDTAKFIEEYARKYQITHPADMLPAFLAGLTQPQRENLSVDLQERVATAQKKAQGFPF